MSEPLVKFLNVTFYTSDVPAARAFYADALGLPVDFEDPGHLAAMGRICAHDPSEGERAGTTRIYLLSDDPAAAGAAAQDAGYPGVAGVDAGGDPMWDTTDPLGNSVRILKRT